MTFGEHDPCVYFGEILCQNCEQHKRCDMEAGRELRRKSYDAGQAANMYKEAFHDAMHELEPISPHAYDWLEEKYKHLM